VSLLAYLAFLLLLGIIAQWSAWRLKLPSILLLLIFGFGLSQFTGTRIDDYLANESSLLTPKDASAHHSKAVASHLRGRFCFLGGPRFAQLRAMVSRGAEMKVTLLTDVFTLVVEKEDVETKALRKKEEAEAKG